MSDKPDLTVVAEQLGGVPTELVKDKNIQEGDAKLQADLKEFNKVRLKYSADQKGEAPVLRTPKEKAAALDKEVEEELEAQDVRSKQRQAKQEEPAPEPAQEQPQDTDESKKAREFLRLKQAAPPSVIDALSPEDAVEWHTKVARREAEIDRTYREAAELRKQLEEKPEPEPAEPVVPAVELDIEPLKTRLAAALGEEESEGIAAELRSAITRGVEPYKDLLQKAEERIKALETTFENNQRNNTEVISRNNRSRLGALVPVLSQSDKAWSAVVNEVIELAKAEPTRFESAEGFFDEAVKTLYGQTALDVVDTEAEAEEAARLQEEKDRVEASTPTVVTKKSPRKLSADEQQRKIFSHLQKHPGDVHGAKRAAGIS